jgi:hypothetical protein
MPRFRLASRRFSKAPESGEAATWATPQTVMSNFRGDRNLPVAEEHPRWRDVRSSEVLARLSGLSGVVVFLLAAALLVLLARSALLDGVAVLARPEPGLAGIVIGALRDLRLLRHFDLRW